MKPRDQRIEWCCFGPSLVNLICPALFRPVASIAPVLPLPEERGEGRDALAMVAPLCLLVNILIILCVALQGNSIDFEIAISRFIKYILTVLYKIAFLKEQGNQSEMRHE